MQKLKAHGRFIVAAIALAVAFVLSVQFSDRGVQFDLRNSPLSASPSSEASYDLASLKILNRVLLQIKDNYVEPDRIDPNKMLVYALDEIQNSIAEVVVDFDKPKDDHPTRVTVSVNQQKKSFGIDEIESLWEMSYRLKEIFAFVQEHLDGETEVEYRDVEYAAINGMLTTLDPHSTLLPPQNYEEMQTQTGGKFGGLGIVISVRDGKLTVISPIDGTPAARKGIKSRDHIVRIGEESTINMNLNEAVNMLRGEPGTDVELWIERKGWSEPRKYVVTRAEIKIDSVESEPLANKVGYVRIKNFQANTYPDLKKQLGELKEKMGGMRGLVLDMRDNPGGLLDQAIKVSDLFLDEGTIVSTVGVGNRLREKRGARVKGTESKYPIVVLVNAGSASASEIVSGALQNHDRAIVVGDTTFGKGSVQILYEFPDDSALKLTVAQYLTPGGISIQSSGITPDIRTIPVLATKDEVDLFLSQNILREQDLSSHLTNKAVKSKQSEGDYFVRYLQEPPAEDEEFAEDDGFREDFEIKFAQRLVASAGQTYDRPKLLSKLKSEIDDVSKSEFGHIRNKLKEFKVDWSGGPTVAKPNLDVSVTFSPEGRIEAGNKLTMTVSVTNTGAKPVHQLKAISKSESDLLDDREFIFGKVGPGESKSWDVEVSVPKDAPSRRDLLTFNFSDAQTEFKDLAATHELAVVGADRPQFAFSYGVEDTSGDGVLSPGENAKMKVVVKNIGKAASDETLVFLKSLTRESVYLKRGRATLESIPAGEEMAVEFEFDVKDPPKEGEKVKLEVDIYDSTFRQYTQKKFEVPFAKTKKDAKSASGIVEVKNPKTALHAAATTKSERAGIAGKGTRFSRLGTVADYTIVDLRGRRAFVPTKFVSDATGEEDLNSLSRSVMFQPPTVAVAPSTMLTTKGDISIDGNATDDSSVKDYYIFVYNRDETKVNTRKLEYVKVDGSEIKISTKVPLFPGMNRIAVVARDDDGMSTSESAYVYRK